MIGFILYPDWIRPEIIPGFPYLRWYGLMYLVAFSITYLLFKYQVKERGLNVIADDIFSLFFWGIIGLLIGARLFAVTLFDRTGYFLRNPLQAILPISWAGGQCTFTGFQGMSYHGGLLGSIVAIVIYCRVKKIDILDWGDMILAGVPLGYFFGRMGNFINGELYGRITTMPWGMIFPDAETFSTKEPWVRAFAGKVGIDILGMDRVNLPRHPSQLYEGFFEGIFLWLILWFVIRKRKPFKGFVIAAYVIGYGVIRFIIEYARQPDRNNSILIRLVDVSGGYAYSSPWNFTLGQILCFLMIVGGILSLLVFRSRAAKQGQALPDARPNLKKLRKKIK